jgi:predicted dehydrogenase
VYAKARELYRAGAIGSLTLVEAWINRNSALGAWQYTLPLVCLTAVRSRLGDRFIGHAPKTSVRADPVVRWRNYRDYGTGIPGDLFVHLFTGIHFVLESTGPTRVMATGGLRNWNDGRDVARRDARGSTITPRPPRIQRSRYR